MIPSWIIYLPTQPRDVDGMWGFNIFMLPFVAFPVAGAASLGRWLGDAWQHQSTLSQYPPERGAAVVVDADVFPGDDAAPAALPSASIANHLPPEP